jgi:RNA polymerase sigma-70 factor (ECF subfamily)
MSCSNLASPFLLAGTSKDMAHAVQVASIVERSAPSAASADGEARRLTSGVARGEEAAFQELYDRYHERLLRLAFVFSRGDDSLAHDLVQSVMLTAAAKLKPLENEAHLWNWLARVARQHFLKRRRQQQRDSALVSMAELPEQPDEAEPDSMLEESLDAAMTALDADDRQVVEWFYFDGLSHKDIADRVRATPKAVSSRLERARIKLRSLVVKRLSHEA